MDAHERRRAFDRLYEAHARDVLAYALRRTTTSQDAEDVAAEVFVVAWRRFQQVPPVEDALPWLYAVGRRLIANQRRGNERRRRLEERIAREPSATAAHPAGPLGAPASSESPALAALQRLRPDDRELLRLVAWEGLSHADIASTLGITPNAVAIRMHRARRRYEAALGAAHVKGSLAGRTLAAVRSRMFGSAGRNEAT